MSLWEYGGGKMKRAKEETRSGRTKDGLIWPVTPDAAVLVFTVPGVFPLSIAATSTPVWMSGMEEQAGYDLSSQ